MDCKGGDIDTLRGHVKEPEGIAVLKPILFQF